MSRKMRLLLGILVGLALVLGPAAGLGTREALATTYESGSSVQYGDLQIGDVLKSNVTITNGNETFRLAGAVPTNWMSSYTTSANYSISNIGEGTITLQNYSISVSSVQLSPSEAALKVGEVQKLTATVLPDDATDRKVKWSVTGDAVTLYSDADCTAGNEVTLDTATETLTVYAKGISAGSATVTATSNADSTKSASCDVMVVQTYPLWVGGTQVTSANLSGEGWSYTPATTGDNPAPATLTLTDYSYEGEGHGEENTSGAIYAKEDLTIIANGNNTVTKTGTAGAGIYVDTNLTVGGSGTLSVTGNETNGVGISCNNVTIGGGTVEASGFSCGVFASKNITITGCTVDARSTSNTGKALQCFGVLRIESGTVDAAGGPNGNGVFGMAGVEIEGGSVIATGSDGAIYGTVKNSIAGTGWTDTEGKQGKATIAVGDHTADDLKDYKKAKFPEEVTKFTVTLKGGANASSTGGTAEQAVEEGGAMKTVTYTANSGYHFEDFKAITSNGVTAELDGGKVVVSGTPTADVSITVPDAVADSAPEPEPAKPAKVAAPSTVAHVAAGAIDVSWKKAKGAKTYQVQWRVAGAKKWATATVKGTKKTITGLKAGKLYDVRVRGVDGSARGAWSTPARQRWLRSVSKAKAKPGTSKGSVKVSWKKDKSATGGYQVRVYAKKGGKAVATKTVSKAKTSATITNLKSGKTYYVRVRPLRTRSGKTYVGALSGYRSAKAK